MIGLCGKVSLNEVRRNVPAPVPSLRKTSPLVMPSTALKTTRLLTAVTLPGNDDAAASGLRLARRCVVAAVPSSDTHGSTPCVASPTEKNSFPAATLRSPALLNDWTNVFATPSVDHSSRVDAVSRK